jgi:plastocyanin
MYKKLLIGLLVFSLLTAILAACSIRDETGTSGPSVHMTGANFTQSSVTINKGDTLNLIDDAAAQHIIKNGTWAGSTPKPKTESGAPTVDVTLNGNDNAPVGPFSTAGTFQLYCTIHPGMNLTVIVK